MRRLLHFRQPDGQATRWRLHSDMREGSFEEQRDVAPFGFERGPPFDSRRAFIEHRRCDLLCSSWGSYINGSLKNLIATGKGRPNRKE
jgi:hypothetical protein